MLASGAVRAKVESQSTALKQSRRDLLQMPLSTLYMFLVLPKMIYLVYQYDAERIDYVIQNSYFVVNRLSET